MQWYKITISTTIYAQDLVGNLLYDMGISGFEVINNIPITEKEKAEMFIDFLPEVDLDDVEAHIVFYLEPEEDIEQTVKDVELGLNDIRDFVDVGSGNIEVTTTKDEDWANNWKKYFKPFRVAEDIVIKPTWEILNYNDKQHIKDGVTKEDIIIEIDPEMAFGTGSHETTRLAIDGIKKHLKADQSILDLGCGSGILSIIARKLGAGKVAGTDIDAKAVETAKENAIINSIAKEDITFIHGDVLDTLETEELDKKIGLKTYDIVVANILAPIIIEMSNIVWKYLKQGGYFISTGILNSQSDEVRESLIKNGFEIVEENAMGDWISITARLI